MCCQECPTIKVKTQSSESILSHSHLGPTVVTPQSTISLLYPTVVKARCGRLSANVSMSDNTVGWRVLHVAGKSPRAEIEKTPFSPNI